MNRKIGKIRTICLILDVIQDKRGREESKGKQELEYEKNDLIRTERSRRTREENKERDVEGIGE